MKRVDRLIYQVKALRDSGSTVGADREKDGEKPQPDPVKGKNKGKQPRITEHSR